MSLVPLAGGVISWQVTPGNQARVANRPYGSQRAAASYVVDGLSLKAMAAAGA